MFSLNEKVALVTGAAQGLGRDIALLFARQGAIVIGADINIEKMTEVADEEGNGKIIPLQLDVTDSEAVNNTVDSLVEEHQKIDILVNNAGITRDKLMLQMDDDDWDAVLTVNLKSAFLLTRAVSRHMLRARKGRIINMASVAGVAGNPGQANYAASKGGLISFTKTVGKELAKRNITCNAVAPGFIATAMTDILPQQIKDQAKLLIPCRRFGKPEEVAAVVAFLASDEAGYLNGLVIQVDGGMFM